MQRPCEVGDRPTATAVFYDLSDPPVATNPTTVKVLTRSPAGTETVYVYGVDVQVTNPSTGVFQFLFPQITTSGSWYIRFNGTGTITASVEDAFPVTPSKYTTPLP